MALGSIAKGAAAGIELGADISKGTIKGVSAATDISKAAIKGSTAGADIGKAAIKVSPLDRLRALMKGAGSADTGKVAKVAGAVDTVADTGKVAKVAGAVDTVADAGKTTKTLSKTTQDAVKEGVETAAKGVKTPGEFISKFAKKYGKYIVGGLAIGTIATIAGVNSEKINNTKYNITSIKKDPQNASYTIITYTPNDKYSDNDKITISNSDSVESIDGKNIPIYDVIEAGTIKINKSITVEGTKGQLRCHTTFGNQFGKTINDIADPVIKEVVKVGSSVTKNVVDKTFEELGLPKPSDIINNIKDFLKSYWWVILLVSLLPIILSSILFVVTKLT